MPHSRHQSAIAPMAVVITLLATACTAGPLDVLDNGLSQGVVAHWALDERSGNRVVDTSGNGHDGTATGATWIQGGHFNGALHFEQGNEVQVPSFPSATTDWTVTLWVRPTAADANEQYITLLSTEKVFEGGWEMNMTTNQNQQTYQFGYYVGPATTDYYTYDCSCVTTQNWTHLAAVVRGATGKLSFYRDGLYQGEGVAPSSAKIAPIRPGISSLYMGRWSMADRLFRGDLDEIVIYNRALSAAEISAMARASTPSGS